MRKTDRTSSQLGWGYFCIDQSLLTYEYWEVFDGQRTRALKYDALILNDTTLLVNGFVTSEDDDYTVVEDTFSFRRLLPKIDSVSAYLEG